MPDEPTQIFTKDGPEWLQAFMNAQAMVAGQSMWITFTLGQLGAATAYDEDQARLMLEAAKVDRRELREAMDKLDEMFGHILANAERNLERRKEPRDG